MNISELNSGQKVTILAVIGEEQIEFDTTVDELEGDRATVYAKPIYQDEKLMGFKGRGIRVHLIVPFRDKKPQVFEDVTISTVRYEKDSRICYEISTNSSSREINRRGAFRCYVGKDGIARISREEEAVEILIRDISITGFSFIVRDGQTYENGRLIHTMLNDKFEDEEKEMTFYLSGVIVNGRELQNGNRVYGCRFLDRCAGLESYIAKKERLHLQKERGNLGVNMTMRKEGALGEYISLRSSGN